MMVINAEPGQLPDPAAILLARWAWRYRSELAPPSRPGRAGGAGWQAHRAVPAWWPLILTCSAAAAGSPRRSARGSDCPRSPSGSTRPAPRVAAGGWLAAATAARPVHAAAAASPGHRRARARGAVVGAPTPAREGPRGAHARRVAGHLPGHRPARLAGHVRDRGPVGLAGTAPAGPRADHRRRDRADTRDRIGARHLPRRGARLPDPRRQGQPVRAAGARQPTRTPRRSPGPDRPPRPSPSRSTSGRSRTPNRAACCSCAGTRCSPAPPGRARAAASTCSWPPWPPAATWSSGPSTSRRAWNWPLGIVHRPARHHPRGSRRAARRRGRDPAGPRRSSWPPPAAASGNRPPSMPALVIIIDEYAELADEAPTRWRHRLHRPPGPRGRGDPGRRDPAADPEGHGTGRGPLADGHADLLPRPRTPRRRPGPRDRACSPPDGTPTRSTRPASS